MAFAATAVVSGPPDKLSWVAALVVVAILAGIGTAPAIGAVRVSVAGIAQIAAIPLVGPVGAGLIAVVPTLVSRRSPVKDVFNAAQRLVLVLAGAGAYHLAGGTQLVSGQHIDAAALGWQMATAALVAALTNNVLLAGVLQLSTAGSLRVISVDLIRQVVPDYASYLVAAYLLTILWAPAGLGWVSTLFFLPSLLVIQWGLRQHAAEWSTRHEVLSPFLKALELRQQGAMADARVVSAAAGAIATGMGLKPATVDEITIAARMRRVGMLALPGVPPAVVRRHHPAAARQVLGEMSFLDRPLDLIAAHHERFDGTGQPHGLSGELIPVGSRVIAVADMWGQLVLDGWAPAHAVDQCEAVAGRSLDPTCVAALRRALERNQLPEVGE